MITILPSRLEPKTEFGEQAEHVAAVVVGEALRAAVRDRRGRHDHVDAEQDQRRR